MTIVFTDPKGYQGEISDSLAVDYEGPWEQEVREIVEATSTDLPDDPLYDPGEPLSYLVVKLPEDAPIREVGRLDRME